MDGENEAGPSRRQVEGEEVDADWLKLVKTHHDVGVADTIKLDELPLQCNLLAVSNLWGLLIVGGTSSVYIHRLSDVHKQIDNPAKDAPAVSTEIQRIPLPDQPVWVRLAYNEERLIVATKSAGVHSYNLAEILRSQSAPSSPLPLDTSSPVVDLLPNPAAPSSDPYAKYVAVLAEDGAQIVDMDNMNVYAGVSAVVTCGCWSAKGKQIVLGTKDGVLRQHLPDGVVKAEIPPPPELDNPGAHPNFVRWIETDLFLVSYVAPDSTLEDSAEMFVISRTKTELVYTKYYDPIDTMGFPGRSGLYRYFASLTAWGPTTKGMGFVTSGLASEVATLHAQDNAWTVLMLDETARATLPTGKKGVSEDTSCLGLDLDLTCTKPLRRGMEGGVELPDLPPAPRLLVYSQNGVIVSYDIHYPEGGEYPHMVKPGDIRSTAMTSVKPTAPTFTPQASDSVKSSAFGGPGGHSAPSAFGTTAVPPSTAPAFGSSAFGIPADTSLASPPSSVKPTTGFAGFGQMAAAAPAAPKVAPFGQSGLGQQSAGTSAFGSSAFGASAQSGSTSAFGQAASPASTTPSSTPAKPSTSGAFGQPAFGQTASFGQSSFGKPATFGQPSTAATATGFGQSAFGSKTGSATAFGTAPSTTGGFGAFSSTPAGTTTGFSFGSSAFGQKADSSGAATKTGGSAFGSTSAFGQSSFGASTPTPASGGAFAGFGQTAKSSGFAGFGSKPTTSAATPGASSPGGGDEFGLGGFASALHGSSSNSVPGLDDSPPTSPILGSRKPSGLDDSPPTSPPFKPQTTKPASTASAFIKPATAFAGSTSSFGNFGNPAGSSAFGTPAKPAAFGSTTPAAPPKPAATKPAATPPATAGGVTFGQSSAIKTPAFGGSAFGQSSPITAFGQASKPASGGFGSISGGFGGFAAKATPSQPTTSSGGFGGFAANAVSSKPTAGSGGFGGFAAASPGSNIFGQPTAARSSNPPAVKQDVPASPSATESPATPAGPTSPPIAAKTPTPAPPQLPPTPSPDKEVAGYDVPSQSPVPPPVAPEPAVMPPGHATKEPQASASASPKQSPIIPEPAIMPPGHDSKAPPSFAPTASTKAAESVPLPPIDKAPSPPEPNDLEDEGVIVFSGGIRAEAVSDQEHEGEGEGEGEDADEEEEEEEEEDGALSERGVGDDAEEGEGEEEGEEEEEDYDEEDEDGDDEEDEEEEEALGAPLQEMPSIEEEDEDGAEEEEEAEAAGGNRSGLKSPPTWFTKNSPPSQVQAPHPVSASTPEGASLLSRLGSTSPSPPSTSQPPKFTLLNKYAARTASPLGSQPPSVPPAPKPKTSPSLRHAEDSGKLPTTPTLPATDRMTATAKVSPTAPTVPVKEESKDPPKPLFSGFGSASPGVSRSPAPAAAASPFSFGLGRPPAATPPVVPSAAPAAPQQPFNFGLGKPSAPSAEPAPPSLFGLPSVTRTEPTITSPAFFGSTTQSRPPLSATTSKPAAAAPPPPATSFSTPTRQAVPPAPISQSKANPSMSSVLEGMIWDLQADLKQASQLQFS